MSWDILLLLAVVAVVLAAFAVPLVWAERLLRKSDRVESAALREYQRAIRAFEDGEQL
jgi:cytochrome c oxidase assembly factor CtaG